ncbi:hypothetical protein GH742_05355 [Legionella sp. MW5194]|uniref:hypothetical protein n=1 Tax=Legionella sp. MW5194 TaxID=2662448 RepID=UPI00193D1997|nr:hypothetical protein [Legionella sp. MW5194]QRN03337.1 hypothetical protein GH742_05355 [Legionella sp. MW5194]
MPESLHSLLISQVLGFYLLIVAIVMLTRAGYYRNLMTNLHEGSHAILIGATFSLIIGIILVLVHNLWVWDEEVIITIIAWLILIKSVLWLAFPEKMMAFSRSFYAGPGYYITAGIALVLGIVLLAYGFYLYV